MSATVLQGHGIVVRLPARWEGRIYHRAVPTADRAIPALHAPAAAGRPHPGGHGWLGEQVHPVTHLANFALPAGRGDFGSGAVEIMRQRHIFIALLEFGPECLGTALYEAQGMPRPGPEDFRPGTLQRRLAGQAGFQSFFTERERPLCLYAVLGSYAQRRTLCGQVREALDGIEVGPR